MKSSVTKRAGMKIFEKHLKNYEPTDPLYEEYIDSKGKTRQRKRELPPGLSERDARILRKIKFRAHHLDKGFRICGMRFGWTAIIGLVPVLGDVADIGINYLLVVKKARQAEIPPWLLRKMLLNNAVSAGVGFVPIIGDILLAVYKSNSRNAALLEEYLRIRGEEFLRASSQRQEDPEEVRPGAGLSVNNGIPGSSGASITQNTRKGKTVTGVDRKKA